MRFRNFLDKHIFLILTLIGVSAALLTLLFLHNDASRDIGDQINGLYEKERLVEQDFANVFELTGVSCQINDENNKFTFRDKDCLLVVTYNKNGELLEKEFSDERLGSNFLASIFLVFSIGIAAFLVSALLLAGLDEILRLIEVRKRAKQERNQRKDSLKGAG